MTYSQSKELFAAMDNLETYSKLHSMEIHKDKQIDYEAVTRYSRYIEVARSKIFNMMEQSQ